MKPEPQAAATTTSPDHAATNGVKNNRILNRPLPPLPLHNPGPTEADTAVNGARDLFYEEPNLVRCLIHEQAKSLVALQVRQETKLSNKRLLLYWCHWDYIVHSTRFRTTVHSEFTSSS